MDKDINPAGLGEVAEQVKTMANRFRGILLLADALEKVGNVTQATKEANAAFAAANERCSKVAAELRDAEDALKVQEKANAVALAAAQARAAKVLQDAKD